MKQIVVFRIAFSNIPFAFYLMLNHYQKKLLIKLGQLGHFIFKQNFWQFSKKRIKVLLLIRIKVEISIMFKGWPVYGRPASDQPVPGHSPAIHRPAAGHSPI